MTNLTRRSALALAAVVLAGAAGASPAAAGERPIVSWVNAHAVPLASVHASGPVDDLEPLRRIVGEAAVVGLGEPSHGTHEQVTARHRMIRFLVEELGFRTVAWEESWGSGVAVDRYVVTGRGDPRRIVSDMGFQWRSEAMLELVRWMRAFNRDRAEEDKVRFLGPDVMELRALPFTEVRRHVRSAAPELMKELDRHLDPIRFRGSSQAHFGWYFQQPPTARRQFILHARAVAKLVSSLPPGPSRDEAVQHAQAILGFYESHAEDIVKAKAPIRDRYIADFVGGWRSRTNHKIVYNAANVHTTASPQVTWKFPPNPVAFANKTMAGGHLRKRYGSSYVSIGTVSRHGRVLLGWETGKPSVFTVPPAGPRMVDYQLGKAEHDNYLIDLHAEAPAVVRRWLDGPATMRVIGTAYDPKRDADYMMSIPSLRRGFDAVLHLGETTPTRLLR
ncbi:erythromycin esterase family protein [Thermoactinospora rubra]|uniref:erythromycin esterase family protein n=1 Tax=Thermoactinospora rubra TaxID=1088767 RepID=UPI000A0FFD88|nr:erythromycin esterase family protein [Thermoactinospora rubra]